MNPTRRYSLHPAGWRLCAIFLATVVNLAGCLMFHKSTDLEIELDGNEVVGGQTGICDLADDCSADTGLDTPLTDYSDQTDHDSGLTDAVDRADEEGTDPEISLDTGDESAEPTTIACPLDSPANARGQFRICGQTAAIAGEATSEDSRWHVRVVSTFVNSVPPARHDDVGFVVRITGLR